MKKMLILVVAAIIAVGSLYANESVLIDFGQLAADMRVSDTDDGDDTPNQNRATLMDFSNVRFAGSFTEEQRGFMRSSLAIENWEVDLATSANTITNRSRSYTREAPSARFGTVMGVRVHFPLGNFHSWARVRPPFEVPGFEPAADVADDGTITPTTNGDGTTRFENGHGLVKNVATIRALAATVYGMNFPHSLSVVLLDNDGNRTSIPLGNLQFDGWAELRWDNPNYITEIRNRDLRITPFYPDAMPFVKFGGFEIRRDASHRGGDFIGYFKDVRIIYDLAVLDTDRDIDDEGVWGLIHERESARRVWEIERFGQDQILRHLESQRQATGTTFTPSAEAE
jgi:hypothetical protein